VFEPIMNAHDRVNYIYGRFSNLSRISFRSINYQNAFSEHRACFKMPFGVPKFSKYIFRSPNVFHLGSKTFKMHFQIPKHTTSIIISKKNVGRMSTLILVLNLILSTATTSSGALFNFILDHRKKPHLLTNGLVTNFHP